MPILFHSQKNSFVLKNKTHIRSWIDKSVKLENKGVGDVNYIFCDDEYLLTINQQYLNHDTYTDIITFDSQLPTPNPQLICGDIFISIERVKENSISFKKSFDEELRRVMIHGVLHLCGYKDKSKSDKKTMTAKEDKYLSIFTSS